MITQAPDENLFIVAAQQFGVTLCKAKDTECFLATKRTQINNVNNTQDKVNQPKRGKFQVFVETNRSTNEFIVRQFKRMATFEFGSARKRMSVIYKDVDND